MNANENLLEEKRDEPGAPQFERHLDHVGQIIEKLEDDALNLESSLDLFESGVHSLIVCRKALEAAEKRVENLVSTFDELEGSQQENAQNEDLRADRDGQS
jgi:exodeoxyribonuclease VII small subunit